MFSQGQSKARIVLKESASGLDYKVDLGCCFLENYKIERRNVVLRELTCSSGISVGNQDFFVSKLLLRSS